jgi:hypothetical protein
MFSSLKGIKSEINKRGISGKSLNMCKLNKALLNNYKDRCKITREFRK